MKIYWTTLPFNANLKPTGAAIYNMMILLAVVLAMPFTGIAQVQDSVRIKAAQIAAAQFAQPRPFNIEYKRVDPFNFSSKLNGQDLPEGRTASWSQFSAGVDLHIPLTKRLFVQGSAFYRSISTDVSFATATPQLPNRYEQRHQYHSEGIGLGYFSTLFGKPAVYTGSVFADGSEQSYERIKGLFTGTVILKADATTKMSAGLAVTTDPSMIFPLFPVFQYERKLNSSYTLDLMLPRHFYLRKQMFNYGRLSAGGELDGQSTFFLYNVDQTGKTYQYRQVDVDLGLLYEHLLPGNITVSLRGGYRVLPFARVFDKNESFNDYILDVKADPAPYFNIGLSFNPFAKPRR
jgi:hypothetical protein